MENNIETVVLANDNGMLVTVINYGAIITSIKIPVDGELRECVLGFDEPKDYWSEKYLENYPYLGALIGRNAGRIAFSEFSLNGKKITISPNSAPHHLHGGYEGFDKKLWKISEQNKQQVTSEYFSKDGEEGYPGNLKIKVIYSLNNDNELKTEYFAETDQATFVNLTQHSYFNFNPNNSGDILDHILKINSSKYVPLNDGLLPKGIIENVEETNYDYRNGKNPTSDLDNSFVVENKENPAGNLTSPDGKITMQVTTDNPVLHIYTGYYLQNLVVEGRKNLSKNAGICFEAQGYADAPNQPDFDSTQLSPGEIYHRQTIFKFKF